MNQITEQNCVTQLFHYRKCLQQTGSMDYSSKLISNVKVLVLIMLSMSVIDLS